MATPVTITASLTDPSSTALQGNSFLRFILRNFSGFVPQVSGTSILPEIQVDALPNGSGLVSQTLWKNSDISPATTFYTVQLWNQGRITSSGNYIFNASSSLNSVAQLNAPPVPPGFALVLQNNDVLNSSQSTLDLKSTDGSVTITDLGAGKINLKGAIVSGPRPTIANWHGWTFPGGTGVSSISSSTVFPYGDSPTTAGNSYTGSGVNATATDTNYFRIQVDTSSSIYGGIYSGGGATLQGVITLGILQYLAQRVRITTAGSQRCWIGMIDVSVATPIGSGSLNTDTPAQSFVGFRYSTAAGDTNWMAVTNTAGTQTATSTGIAPDTNGHVFAIQQSNSGATVNFFIDGVQVATSTTNVPANTFGMRAINSIQALGAVTNRMDTAWVYWETLP